MASTLRARPLEEKAICARRVEAEVLPALAAGRMRVPVAARFSLDEAARRLRALRRRRQARQGGAGDGPAGTLTAAAGPFAAGRKDRPEMSCSKLENLTGSVD